MTNFDSQREPNSLPELDTGRRGPDHEQLSEPANYGQAELDTEHRQRAELANRNLAAIIDQSEDAIISKTPDGMITGWNRGAEQLYGYAAEDVLGRSIALLYDNDRLPELMRILESIRRGEHVHQFETVHRAKNGGQVEVRLSVSPIRDQKGTIVAASAIARDLTSRREAAAALVRSEAELQRLNAHLEELVRERTQQLEAANKELEAFAYSVSHDLRAPLRAIDGFSAAVVEENGEHLDERGKRHLSRVRSAVQRMAHLIDDLLKLSRISRAEIQSTPVDLSVLVGEVMTELQQAQPDRQVELVVQPDLVATADPHLMRIALENLLGNAWKFTRHTPQPRLEFGRSQLNGVTWFMVRDNGAGFDMAYADKLFGAFQRLHSAQEYEGTGIGLATVQRIMRRHGGDVRAEGRPGLGATFYFSLPPFLNPFP